MKTKLTTEQKTANKLARQEKRKAAKEIARIEAEKNQAPVKVMKIFIEWKKSRTWGNCPRAYAEISFQNGEWLRTDDNYYASGCGYDKESTVVADIFNDFLKYKLWQVDLKTLDKDKKPYGISLSENYVYYAGGIGISCYYKIAEFIGAKFENICSGKTFDVYQLTF